VDTLAVRLIIPPVGLIEDLPTPKGESADDLMAVTGMLNAGDRVAVRGADQIVQSFRQQCRLVPVLSLYMLKKYPQRTAGIFSYRD